MHIETCHRHGKHGRTYTYQVARIYLGHGRRASIHVPKGMTMDQFMAAEPARCSDFLALERTRVKKSRLVPPSVGSAVYGPTFSREMRSLLADAGYSVCGSAIKRNRRTFFNNPRALALRYELLDPEFKLMVGSPGELGSLELQARSLVKAANARRRKIGLTFEEAMAEVLRRKVPAASSPMSNDLPQTATE